MSAQVTPRKYRIERYLAEGGMGAIYLGKKLGPGGFEKEVVLKQLLPEFTSRPEFRDLFFREAKISATLDHVNIVRTFDLVRSEDALFIVMEYVRGADLRTISWRARRRRRALSPAAVVHVAIEILNGLSYAHGRRSARGEPLGIIHRDVSPSNILCSAQGEVKLSDFGIAKAVTYSSVFYRVRGKVGYMSPEQARNQPLDARSDLFSLAVCIFETLMGERLYTGDLQTPADVIYAQAIPSLLEKCPSLPPDLESVMRQALALERDHRFVDAAAFAQALRQVARANGILYTAPELAAELSGLLGDNADRWLAEDAAVSMVTQGMPEPRQLEGKEAASIGLVDLEGSPSPRSPDSRTVPIVSASSVGAVADTAPHTLQAEAARRRPSSANIPAVRPSQQLAAAPPTPERRRRSWRLLGASCAALVVGLLVVGLLAPEDNPVAGAVRSLRHKIALWRE
jgi:serine/threonine protein kinase